MRYQRTMKVHYILSCILLFSVVMVTADIFYNSKYDSSDIQPLLENDRILQGYTKCFLDQGPCTPDAKDFKKVIPEALETTCGKCTPKQKHLIKQMVQAVMERHPDAWDEIIEKYDKDKTFIEAFDKFLAETD